MSNRHAQREERWRLETANQLREQGLEAAATNFCQCGRVTGVVTCSRNMGHYSMPQIQTCHLRFCPSCARRDARRLTDTYTDKIRAAIKGGNRRYRLRLITLTTDISLTDPEICKKFTETFRAVGKLFDHLLCNGAPYWSQKSHRKYTGEGYLACAEFGTDGRKLHFHVLFYGRFLEQKRISEVWRGLTNCPVVWIEGMRARLKDAMREALKYVTKFTKETTGQFAGFPDPALIARLAFVFQGARRVRTRGLFYNLPSPEEILETPIDTQPVACPECFARLTIFDPETWVRMHAGNHANTLHLKQGNKFFYSCAPPS